MFKKTSPPVVVVVVVLLLCGNLHSQSWSGILSPSRAVDWSAAGVPGGIPSDSWTQCGSTISAYSGSAATISNAIASCGKNQYVQLGAGTFQLSSGITWGASGKSNVALRGMGADQTFIVFTGGDGCRGAWAAVCMASVDTNWSGGPSNTASWTAGYSQGTTSITLSSHNNLKVGQPLILDQADDASDTGTKFVCQSTSTSPPCSLEGNVSNGQRTNRDQVQIVTVAACGTSTPGAACSSNTITISPGLYATNWNSSHSPGAWWATTPVYNDGVENLSIDVSKASGIKGVEFFNCLGCWVSGIRSVTTGKAHVESQESAHNTVQHSYFYGTQNSVSQSYGIEAFNASDELYVNNIFQYVTAPLMDNGSCDGCVWAYNFAVNDYYEGSAGFIMLSAFNHTAGSSYMLFEGNDLVGMTGDNFHGTHNLVTIFRNRLRGSQDACYNGTANRFSACNNDFVAIDLRAYSRLYNIIGNVLGTSGVSNGYESGTKTIYALGAGNNEGSVTVPNDSLVASTLMRWGNYDTVSGATRWNSSEVPSGLAQYANPVPASDTLPASFYLRSKPSWWPSSIPWPAIGPDVTGGDISGVAGHAYMIPAQDCYLSVMSGPADGTGAALKFNVSACYGSNQSAPSNGVPPPTGVTAVVH